MIYSICRFKYDLFFFAVCVVKSVYEQQLIRTAIEIFIQMLFKVLGRTLLSVLWSQKIMKCLQNHPNPLIKARVHWGPGHKHHFLRSEIVWCQALVFQLRLRRLTSAQPVQVFIIIIITKQRGRRGTSFQTLRTFTQELQSVHS